MKKIILGICVLGAISFLSTDAVAQFKNGDKLLNLGFGVNSYYTGGIPLSASFEVGVTDDISVGGGLDYLSYNYSGYGRFTAIYIGGRGSYHFSRVLNLRNEAVDIYGGLSLGYRSFSWNDRYIGPGLGNVYGSGLFLGIHAGARYYFTKKVGGFLELGALGSTNARLGVAFKF
ncbi:MAG: hypothetical protein JSS79_19240 [Bacteroidetes bacterium]|nr:hypothetical protein [Bacteroidota bacterium]